MCISVPQDRMVWANQCRFMRYALIRRKFGESWPKRSLWFMQTFMRRIWSQCEEIPIKGGNSFVSERFQYPKDREIYSAAKVKALESLLVEKGIISSETVDKVLNYFEKEMGPFNGASLVAKPCLAPQFKARLLEHTPAAIAEMNFPRGMTGAEGENMEAVENTSTVHNLIVCTLCSCYPWPILGLPPYWYKD